MRVLPIGMGIWTALLLCTLLPAQEVRHPRTEDPVWSRAWQEVVVARWEWMWEEGEESDNWRLSGHLKGTVRSEMRYFRDEILEPTLVSRLAVLDRKIEDDQGRGCFFHPLTPDQRKVGDLLSEMGRLISNLRFEEALLLHDGKLIPHLDGMSDTDSRILKDLRERSAFCREDAGLGLTLPPLHLEVMEAQLHSHVWLRNHRAYPVRDRDLRRLQEGECVPSIPDLVIRTIYPRVIHCDYKDRLRIHLPVYPFYRHRPPDLMAWETRGSVWILNFSERPAGDPQPGDLRPIPRRVVAGQTIHDAPDVRVRRFEEDKVICRFRGAYEFGLTYGAPVASVPEKKPWDTDRQRGTVQRWESMLKESLTLIGDSDEVKKNKGLETFGIVREEIQLWEERITHPDTRARMEGLQAKMREEWGGHPTRIKRWIRKGHRILIRMDRALRGGRDTDVLQIFEENLVPFAESIVQEDPDTRQIADDLLEKGRFLRAEAQVNLEIQGFRLELLSTDGAGSAIILNHAEAPPRRPPPDGWRPRGKRYRAGESIEGIRNLKILRIEKDRVRSEYRGKYLLDLLLTRTGDDGK